MMREPRPAAVDPSELRDLIAKGDAGEDEAEEGLVAINKGELFARVKARTGDVRGREVRQVIDVVLDELGAALVAGEALKLPPLGTVKVQRSKEAADADLVICKLRRKKPGAEAKDSLAEPAEEG